ncbi:peptidylprolyl isomerase [Prosthecobacter sp. SYSU 5D2]|uniref:peptidylprolyl isomerase n=1 Tax=Prosthecobacter sp. SYSU 5D2 TaxID=3134134 RepID=UPI0031FF2E4E
MKPWILPFLLAFLVAAGHFWRDSLRDHLLGRKALIHDLAVRQEEAALVFRQGHSSATPEAARQSVMLEALVRQQRLMDTDFHPDIRLAYAAEWQAWARQWEIDGERLQRLAGQGLTETQMQQSIQDALLDQAWIEEQVSEASQVSDEELETALKQYESQMLLPQVHRVAHLFLSRHGSVKKDRTPELALIRQKLAEGEDWAALAQRHSEDARSKLRAGDLGWMSMERMPAEFMAAVKGLKPGQTSGPVSSPLGWHLIRVLERKPARKAILEEGRSELESLLSWRKRTAALEDLPRRFLQTHPRSGL